MSFDINAARSYGTGSAGDVTNPSNINSYAAVTAIADKTITISADNLSAFTPGTEILLHLSGAKSSSANTQYLGHWKFAKIMAVSGNVLTLSTAPLNITVDNWFYQAVTVPHYKTLTLSGTLTPPAFNASKGCGGILVFKCSSRLVMSGAINLVDKGLNSNDQRPLLNQEQNGTADTDTYSAHENSETQTHFTLQKGDGAAFIIAKTIDFESSARIGDPSLHGVQRTRTTSTASNIGGSSILIVAKTINDFDPAIIAKYRANTREAGRGLGRAYIATESKLPHDEGLYAYDIINTPERLAKATGIGGEINGFGNGIHGVANSPGALQNNYARVSKISDDGKTFTLTNTTTNGFAKFVSGALVMIHASWKNSSTRAAEGRFFLSHVAGITNDTKGKLVSITLNKSIKDLGINNFDVEHYNFQAVAIPQYTSFTLTADNNKTPKYNGCGGIFAIAVNGTCDLSSHYLDVRGKGGAGFLLNNLSNAQLKHKLPIGKGHGSVFILAKSLKVNSSSRIGSTKTGNAFGGAYYTVQSDGGWQGKRRTNPDKYAGYGGSGSAGGSQYHKHNGGFDGNNANATDLADSSTNYGGFQGASVFIVAQTIDGLCLDCLSTGGAPGNITDQGAATNVCKIGEAGGCGYGGGGASWFAGTKYNYGGQGGVHGGGSGASNSDDSHWSGGGGASGFCAVYCNKFTNQSTTNLIFD